MITVVIPSYNSAKYIARVIESIQAQTYTDWELICVDDCSADSTPLVVKQYQSQDSRIKLMIEPHNTGGARKPRYDGIRAASGRYVTHIDSDDFVEPDYLAKMLCRMEESKARLILSQLVYCSETEQPDSRRIPAADFDLQQIVSGKEACKLTLGNWRINMAGLLMEADFYRQFIDEVYDADCDSCFNDELDYRKLLLTVSNVAFSDARYYYRQHGASVVHLPVSQFIDRLNEMIPLHTLISSKMDDPEVLRQINENYLQSLYFAVSTLYEQKKRLSQMEYQDAQRNIDRAYRYMKTQHIMGSGLKYKLISTNRLALNILAEMRHLYVRLKS
jgi:glycosyltransferase involved in cell wall biosynthesis